jgi:hypothetical protein
MKFRPIATRTKLIALVSLISLASCKKDVTSAGSNDSNAASLSDSSTAADNVYYDVLNTALVGTSDNISVWSSSAAHAGKTTTLSTDAISTAHLGCAIYSIDDSLPDSYPKTLTLNFGTGCTSADGIIRKGIIKYYFTGPLLVPGDTVTAIFQNYVVNGYGIQGAYTIVNTSTQLIPVAFTTRVTNGIITYPNATNYHYSHYKSFALTSGFATPANITDDVYSITGNSAFSSSDGTSLVFNVTTPLIRAISCPNVSAGVVGFMYDQSVSGTIDFGDGTCDNVATVTVGNIHRTIALR